MKYFRILAMWSSAIMSSIIFSAIVLLCYPLVRIAQPHRHILHSMAQMWANTVLFLNPWWKFSLLGKENLPQRNKPVVIVANHKSQADILAMYLLGLRFRWVAKSSLYQIPLFGWAMKAVGYVSISRFDKTSQVKCIAESAKHLREGKSMLFFPEGTRSSNGMLLNFKSGAFRLATECGVDILPVTLLGTEKLLPKGSIFPNVAEVKIIVHPLVSSNGKNFEQLNKECRQIIASSLADEEGKTT